MSKIWAHFVAFSNPILFNQDHTGTLLRCYLHTLYNVCMTGALGIHLLMSYVCIKISIVRIM